MAADLYIFFNDRLTIANPDVSITASSTDDGYAIDNVRYADLVRAWKGNDSTTTNEYLQADGGSAGWIGSATETAYAVVAYDNRGADQDTIKLITDSGDSAGFGGTPTTLATWTVSTFKTELTMEWKSYTIQTSGRRYYRLIQYGNERTESAGSVTSKIYCWSMFNADGVLRLPVNYPSDGEAPYSIRTQFKYGEAKTAGGLRLFNKYSAPGQSFNVSFQPASLVLWEYMRDSLKAYGGGARAFFVQKDGLSNLAQSNFFLCRLTNLEITASVSYQNNYNVDTQWETEPWL